MFFAETFPNLEKPKSLCRLLNIATTSNVYIFTNRNVTWLLHYQGIA